MIIVTVPSGEVLQTTAQTFAIGDNGYVGEDERLTSEPNGSVAFTVVDGAEYLIDGQASPFPALVYLSPSGVLTTTVNGRAVDVMSELRAPAGGLEAKGFYTNLASSEFILEDSEIFILNEGDIILVDAAKITGLNGGEVVNFRATKTLIGAASNVTDGDTVITLASGSVEVGQFISVEGDITHANYTPDRQLDAKVCGKVIGVSGLDVTLDRTVAFSLTNVNVYAIPNCELIIKSWIEGCSIDVENVPKIRLDCDITGTVGPTGVFLDINTAAEVTGELRINKASALIVAAFNYISGGDVSIRQEASGNENVGSKVVRGNAVSHSVFSYFGNSARHKDFGFDGARHCTFNVTSDHGGAAMFEANDSSANRLEQCVIAESDAITINANITDANDQGLEIISGTEITINGKVHNSKVTTSTEGALIIKGATDGVRINADVAGYGSRGIKVECSLQAKNVHILPASKVFSSNNSAIAVRDGVSNYAANVTIEGRYAGLTPIEIKEFSQGCSVNAIVDMTLATSAGMSIQAPVSLLSGEFINTSVNKQIFSISNTCTAYRFGKVFADTDDAFITLNGDSRALFTFDRVKNVSAKLVMGGNSTVFFFRNGVPYADVVPTLGAYSAGDFYQRKSSNKPTGSTMEIGRKYDGTSWIQLLCSF